MPKVSVVIPTRDRSGLLALTVRCALRQRGVDLEVVVVDDGSTDDTAGMLRRLGDPRVHLVRHATPMGVSAARNAGVEAARGEWVAFLDDDDLWAPDKLALQLQAAEAAGCSWVYAGTVNVDDRLRILEGGPPPPPERVPELLMRYNPIPAGASNVMVRADALARAGAFDPRLRRTEDWDLWIRLARHGPPAAVCRPLVAYRMHPHSNAFVDTAEILTETAMIERRHGIPIDHAAHYRRAAWISLRAGRRWRAAGYYAHAIRLGDVRSLARAVVGLGYPGVASARRHRLWRPDRELARWRADAQRWLDELVSAPVG
ncbi:MAG TPA: glycosyltransferase [Streptosporangiaceae bacterium]